MGEKIEIITLLQNKQVLKQQLSSLVYGTVEIRENNTSKYIYVHYREDGVSLTKYVEEELDSMVESNIDFAKIRGVPIFSFTYIWISDGIKLNFLIPS